MSRYFEVIKENPMALRACIVALTWVVYIWPIIGIPAAFNSPDESANYLFASHFAETGSLRIQDSLSVSHKEFVSPRSVASDGENLIPGSFIGLPVIGGVLGMMLGDWAILFVFPLLSAVAGLMSYNIFSHFFSRRISAIATTIVLIHPAFWYYSSRPMYHNTLFVSLVIIALVFALRIPRRRYVFSIGASSCAALALIVRPAEVFWVMGLLVLIVLSHRHILNKRHYVALLFPAVVLISGLLVFNIYLYGGPFTTAYTAVVVADGENEQQSVKFVSSIGKALFPYGVDFVTALQSLWKFGVIIFPLFSLFGIMGFASTFYQSVTKRDYKTISYTSVYVMLGIFLTLTYGSHVFSDTDFANPDISASFVRYWIILFVLGAPFIALGLLCIVSMFPRGAFKAVIASSLGFLLIGAATHAVILDEVHGLYQYQKNAIESDTLANRVITETEESAVVIAGYYDKMLMLHRRAIFELPSNAVLAKRILQSLRETVPVYVISSDLDPPHLRTQKYILDMGFSLGVNRILNSHASIQQVLN